jgi:hypothetical protein
MSPHADHQASAGWHFMQDGLLFANLNAQDGRRGQTEFLVQSWWMGMLMRERGRHQLSAGGMLSADPATVGRYGYSEILQVFDRPVEGTLYDRQHPHELLMQASAAWRYRLTSRSAVTIAGGLVGEPALGPVSFLHRPSAADNSMAPLSHHVFDMTHASMGVITAGLDRGPWTVEASWFNARGGDSQRWDLYDPGRLDSWSGRVWFEAGVWQIQGSHGVLKQTPMGDVRRSTGSLGWFRPRGGDYVAAFVAGGRNSSAHHGNHDALLIEAARKSGRLSVSSRFESAPLHAELLGHSHDGTASHATSRAAVVTAGAVFDLLTWRGLEGGVGGDITVYKLPENAKPIYGARPLSFHLFFRLRPPAGPFQRMWNTRMSRPMPLPSAHGDR